MFSEKHIERFWSKVDRSGGEYACWEWQAYKNAYGYGNVWMGFRYEKSHRVAWQIVNGEIPSGLEVCHDCDNPPCCNPKHLFLGTHRDNTDDMVRKQRHQHRLSDAQVAEIRKRYTDGTASQRDLAREYDVSQQLISLIVNRKRYSS